MENKGLKNKGTKIGLILVGIVLTILSGLLVAIFLRVCESLPPQLIPEGTESMESQPETEQGLSTTAVTIIDVGQGSAALIENSGEYTLIDTGSSDRAQVPIAILKRLGAEKISPARGLRGDGRAFEADG